MFNVSIVSLLVAERVASAYKPARLGKSLLLGLSRRSGQTYPLVADRVASQPFPRCLAARYCEIHPTAKKISFHPIFLAVGNT